MKIARHYWESFFQKMRTWLIVSNQCRSWWLVEAGSFSAAARQLKIPLATVSRKVGELESHLKTRLLHRSTRQLSLTEAGQSYVAACRRILEEVGEAERAASGEYVAPKGELVITAPIVFGRLHVLPVIADFLKTHPDIDVRMVLTSSPLSWRCIHDLSRS
jgi:DNA-binding transcriptional LysR family regulator